MSAQALEAPPQPKTPEQIRDSRRAQIASFMGTTVEYYDSWCRRRAPARTPSPCRTDPCAPTATGGVPPLWGAPGAVSGRRKPGQPIVSGSANGVSCEEVPTYTVYPPGLTWKEPVA